MIAPIVLAAGFSTRMGSPKAVLRDREGRPFVVRIVRTLVDAGLAGVTVVASPGSLEAIGRALNEDRVTAGTRLVINEAPERGQLSSIWTAMASVVTTDVEAILLTLVDVPFVSSGTVRRVVDVYLSEHAPIVRPSRGDEHGHPVIFDRALFGELLQADLSAGAKTVVRAHETAIVNVPVDDAGAFLDVDTPLDYERAMR